MGAYHPDSIPIERLHVGQLSWILSFCRLSYGQRVELIVLYLPLCFPRSSLCASLGEANFLAYGLYSFAGLLWQELSCMIPMLRVGVWNPIVPWADFLNFTASVLVAMVAYFAARFIDAMREQMRAKRVADELLRSLLSAYRRG